MSVQEIMESMSNLISIAKPYMDRIDVSYAVADCLKSTEEMSTLYNTDNYNVEELENKKSICSADYIRLEYILAFLPEQHEKYFIRTSIYNCHKRIMRLMSVRMPVDDKIKLLELHKYISEWRLQSTQVDFNYTRFDVREVELKLLDYERRYIDL